MNAVCLWIVTGFVPNYSDSSWWVARVCASREDADARAAEMNAVVASLVVRSARKYGDHPSWIDSDTGPAAILAMDPNGCDASPDTQYGVCEVPVSPALLLKLQGTP